MTARGILIALGLAAVAVVLIVLGTTVVDSRAGSDALILAAAVFAVGAVLAPFKSTNRTNRTNRTDDGGRTTKAGGRKKASERDRTNQSRRR